MGNELKNGQLKRQTLADFDSAAVVMESCFQSFKSEYIQLVQEDALGQITITDVTDASRIRRGRALSVERALRRTK